MSREPAATPTAQIRLPADFLKLIEGLPEKAHDLWATRRLTDGWTPAPRRGDALKQQPCLMPYDDLLESERRYQLEAAVGTLKAISALGYRLVPTNKA